MPKFLSDEWVAQARTIQDEMRDSVTPPSVDALINLVITSVPTDVSESDVEANIDTTDGSAGLDLGHHDTPDATLTLEYEAARSFVVEGNPQVVMQAVMSGRVKITGDMTKLLAISNSLPNEADSELTSRLQAITD